MLLNHSEVQNLVIAEFQRRFKEEFSSGVFQEENIKQSYTHKKSNDFNSTQNIASSNNNTEVCKKSFTADFIVKLISKFVFNILYLIRNSCKVRK